MLLSEAHEWNQKRGLCKIMHIDTEYYKFYDHLFMVNKVT